MTAPRTRWVLALVTGASVALAGCATPVATDVAGSSTTSSSAGTGGDRAGETSAAGSTAPLLTDCGSGALPTVQPGTMTIGTGSPATDPWFTGGAPSNGQGLESAVGYALAGVLGYDRDHVVWTTVDREQALAGLATGFDLDLDQFTAPAAGTPTVDYSTGYFSVTDTLLTLRSNTSPPTGVAALKGQRLGAVSGSAGAATAAQLTGAEPVGFPDQRATLAALPAGLATAVVLPTPAAIAAARADPGLLLIGQLPPDPSAQPTQFAVVLAKGSGLTGCVSGAVDRLRVEGTLAELAVQWVDPAVPQLR